MTAKTAPKPAANAMAKVAKASTKPAPAKPTKPAPKPATPPAQDPVVTPAVPPAPRTGNSAYADEETRTKIVQAMNDLKAKGFTRPSISAVTNLSDSQVWRAQNYKIHTSEVPVIMDFIAKVVAGDVQPPAGNVRKPKVEQLLARVNEAIQVLGNDAKTAAQYRKIVAAAQEILADVQSA
jgi:hypothetical protein